MVNIIQVFPIGYGGLPYMVRGLYLNRIERPLCKHILNIFYDIYVFICQYFWTDLPVKTI